METARRVSVAHVFLIRGGNVLLLKRRNTGHDDGCYGLPAGKIERGETAAEAALREAREECGVLIEPDDLRMTAVLQIGAAEEGGDERIDFFFETERWSGEPVNLEREKCAELRWCPADDLPVETSPFIKEARNLSRRGGWYGSFGMDKKR
ncbi:NUDIX domain-containing protein [Saccharibacillus alkalitolerans]|uniref:NUDIX domain-containing protein n=1 Tax=Saccharibacillus alkalitolerans TaxID=2705290 RepID=A0ABX0F468_9BACL|nr:NUDIX domain-containing protein [Saccharibacillus alkalitolerans]NGZ75772.1 NUDIX domain-containing protein [Saccharibacillus alkalitolerans]